MVEAKNPIIAPEHLGLFDPEPATELGDAMALFHGGDDFWPLLAIRGKEIVACDFPPSPTRLADALGWASAQQAEGFNLYFGIYRLKRPLGKKATKDDVLEAGWLFAEIDPPPELSGEALQRWRAETLQCLRDGGETGIPPTLIVNSGRGLWLFWKLSAAVSLDGNKGEATRRFEAHGRWLEQTLSADSCKNIDRIARLPGFVNRKTGRVAHIVEHDSKRVYDLETFPTIEARSWDACDATTYAKYVDDEEGKAAFIEFLARQDVAVEGQYGRTKTLNLLNAAMDFGLRFETAAEIMEDSEWNDRCQPPWDPGDIAWQLRGLDCSRNDPIGCSHPAVLRLQREKICEDFVEKCCGTEGVGDKSDTGGAGTADAYAHLLTAAWVDKQLPKRDKLLGDLLCTTSRMMIIAATGVGKTLFALDLAAAVAAGLPFLRWKGGRPARVMYLDGEMSAEDMQERQRLVAAIYGKNIKLYTFCRDDLGDERIPPLNTAEGRDWLAERVQAIKPDLIVFDSMMALLGGSLKDDEQWEPMKPVMRALTKMRIAQIWINHIGRDLRHGYGDVTREWEMNTIAALSRVDENDRDSDLRLSFESKDGGKARGRNAHNWRAFEPQILRRTDAGGWVVVGDGVRDKAEVAKVAKAERVFLELVAQFNREGRAGSVRRPAFPITRRPCSCATPKPRASPRST